MTKLRSAEFLDRKGIEYRIIELEERALSIEDVIRFSKEEINVDDICKTMILKDREGGRYAVLLLGGDRVDYGKAREAIGEKVSIASFAEVKEAVGVDPGAVCPLTLGMDLLVDHKVLDRKRINFGSGDHMYGLEIRTRDLEKVVGFRVVDIAKTES
ncbi:YbaK/EbsC family protein [Candidatus Bathyarchaeota archaeon]|nr:YbaK/EbsC family protein [Candidatus Bathyarchaeota archaeon]MBL7079729.1 YbaK/EbsC family protein [Candidatus Bathyarchaeota archaeon]